MLYFKKCVIQFIFDTTLKVQLVSSLCYMLCCVVFCDMNSEVATWQCLWDSVAMNTNPKFGNTKLDNSLCPYLNLNQTNCDVT